MKQFFKKWYTYQKERFPILTYGLYVFCIVFAVFCFYNFYGKIYFDNNEWLGTSSLYEGNQYNIVWLELLPMFIVTFLQFLMVRIVDEFKDYEEDRKYRPYRPVPRGLITLKELKVLLVLCAILQLIITIIFAEDTGGILFLLILWIFFAIMSKGFFIKKFLDEHLLLEVTLDELLLPILVLYLLTFIPQGYLNGKSYMITNSIAVTEINIWKILLMSYVISWIVEVARKVRCKEDEEEGVKTYTALFGIKGATFILFLLETILLIINILIIDKPFIAVGIYIIVNIINLLFVIKKNKTMAKLTELSANIYIMFAYLSLAVLVI